MEVQREWINSLGGYASLGLNNTREEKIKLFRTPNIEGICIDVAHGHDRRVINLISEIKYDFPEVQVIAGNVCTPNGYIDLVSAGADAVKVGIGPGAACLTRDLTGAGVPQFTAVYECGEIAKKYRVPIIADGGIKSSRDIVLALAAGASSVMIGSLFAATYESAAKGTGPGGPIAYTGQSRSNKDGIIDEGKSCYLQQTGSAKDLINNLLGGIRSGMTYGGARTIKELQRKAEFVIQSGVR